MKSARAHDRFVVEAARGVEILLVARQHVNVGQHFIGLGLSLVKLIWNFSHLEVRLRKEPEAGATTPILKDSATFIRLPKLAAALEAVPLDQTLHVEIRERENEVHISTEMIEGSPKEAILNEAESWGADLIVVGSHGYGGFQRFLLGSVSQAVALHARCPVEIARAREDEDDHGTERMAAGESVRSR